MSITGLSPMQGPIVTESTPELEAELSGLTLTDEAPIPETSSGAETAGEDASTQDGLIRLMDYLKKRQGRRKETSNIGRALQVYSQAQIGYVKFAGQHYDREA